MKKALIIVDVQNDFCESGSLAVASANSIIPLINELSHRSEYAVVVATQDFHPQNHSSFKSNNIFGTWPDHCIQGTFGAEFHKDLDLSKVVKVFPKGVNTQIDSYSGFLDNDKKTSTGLCEWLNENQITHVDVVGLALDYCVKATALDAQSLGFKASVLINATKAVNVNPLDENMAILELVKNNVNIITNL